MDTVFEKLLRTAERRISLHPGPDLLRGEAVARLWVWHRHAQEMDALLIRSAFLQRNRLSANGSLLCDSFLSSLRACQQHVRRIQQVLDVPKESEQADTQSSIVIGCGNPGQNGCSDIEGRTTNFASVLLPGIGVNAAVVALGIEVMALTAPRLMANVSRLPGGVPSVHCRREGYTAALR